MSEALFALLGRLSPTSIATQSGAGCDTRASPEVVAASLPSPSPRGLGCGCRATGGGGRWKAGSTGWDGGRDQRDGLRALLCRGDRGSSPPMSYRDGCVMMGNGTPATRKPAARGGTARPAAVDSPVPNCRPHLLDIMSMIVPCRRRVPSSAREPLRSAVLCSHLRSDVGWRDPLLLGGVSPLALRTGRLCKKARRNRATAWGGGGGPTPSPVWLAVGACPFRLQCCG